LLPLMVRCSGATRSILAVLLHPTRQWQHQPHYCAVACKVYSRGGGAACAAAAAVPVSTNWVVLVPLRSLRSIPSLPLSLLLLLLLPPYPHSPRTTGPLPLTSPQAMCTRMSMDQSAPCPTTMEQVGGVNRGSTGAPACSLETVLLGL
jgi:hypothetical protein